MLQGPPAGRVRPVRRAALALPVRVAVHDAGHRGRPREGRRRGRGRPLPPQPPRPGPGGRATSPSSTRCCSPAARPTSARRIVGRAGTVGEAWAHGAAAAARAAGASRSTRARRRRRGSTRSRWSRSARTATRSRSRWPGCGSARGSARARSRSATPAARSRATSGCTAASAPARSSITTSSCSQRKPGGAGALARARARSASRGAWPGCFDELWAALDRPLRALGGRPADGRRRCCSAASTAPTESRSPSAARSPPARIDGRAVAVLARRAETAPTAPAPLTGLEPRLAAHARPAPDLADYDQLLARRPMTTHRRTRRPRRWRR